MHNRRNKIEYIKIIYLGFQYFSKKIMMTQELKWNSLLSDPLDVQWNRERTTSLAAKKKRSEVLFCALQYILQTRRANIYNKESNSLYSFVFYVIMMMNLHIIFFAPVCLPGKYGTKCHFLCSQVLIEV